MKILFVTSEAFPFVSSGGLADVSGSLPKEIKNSYNSDIRVVLPYYKTVKDAWHDKVAYITSFTVTLAWRRLYCGVFSLEHEGITYYFLDNEYYFDRNNVYGDFDDAERFCFFSKAVLDLMQNVNFFPDVLHSNDWQSALSVVYLKKIYINDERYKNIYSVFTIHNIMYQGRYGKELFEDIVGLPCFAKEDLILDGDINFMKGAIQCADLITTVSPEYREELLRGENAYRMEHILRRRENDFIGIINGIDEKLYEPSSKELAYPYNNDFEKFKLENKKSLQREFSLEENPHIPLISFVSRITHQKGIEILKPALEELMCHNIQFTVLGKGDYMDEEFFKYLENKHPDKVRVRIAFDKALSKRIYAGSDIFLMPSKTEPCGIAQMIACRYGAVPVVRETGGLKDTIKCYNPHEEKDTVGFSFYDYTSTALKDTVLRALDLYKNKEKWNALATRAFNKNFSWKKSATIYNEVYKHL